MIGSLLMALALTGAAAEPSTIERGRAAAQKGNWEAAAEHFADALFADERSPEARDLLRTASERVLEDRTAWIQRERALLLFRLGLGPEPPAEEKPPQELKSPEARRIGPPTLELPRKREVRRVRRPVVLETAEPVAILEREPTPADREMARFLYFQGLKAYAENELDEAKQAWRKALEMDPRMERARSALERIQRKR